MSEISFFMITHLCMCPFLKQSCYYFPGQKQSLANVKWAGYVLCRIQLHSASSCPDKHIQQSQYKGSLCYTNDATNAHRKKKNIVMTTTFPWQQL